MIKPSDIALIASADRFLERDRRLEIEEHIDAALTRAGQFNDWPARVKTTRSGWPQTLIRLVLDDYRAAGWIVVPGGYGIIATMSRPDNA